VRPVRELSWQPYPASVPKAERQPCSYIGCDSPAVVVQTQSRGAAATLVFGSLNTTTTPWCREHAHLQGYDESVPPATPRGPLNGFQRLVVRLLSGDGSEPAGRGPEL
jgi:hypothetical protein